MNRFAGISALCWLLLAVPAVGIARELVVVGSYGNQLHLIDPMRLAIERSYRIPGAGTGPTEIAPSPDGRVVYAVTNRWETISGIDLDTGLEVFRANLSVGDVQVRALFGLEVSPDGKWLYVYEQRSRRQSDRYEVLDAGIAVYRTDAGTSATPVRTIPAPRQIQHLAISRDGSTIYAHGLDLYAIDVYTGEIRRTVGITNWGRAGYGSADSMAWLGQQLNAAGVYAMPFYAPHATELSNATVPDDASHSGRDGGVLSVDLRTGAASMDVIGPEAEMAGLTGMSANPRNPREVFGVGSELVKIDLAQRKVVARAPTSGLLFYVVTASEDGLRLYTGGGHCRFGVFSAKDLTTIGVVELPHCAVMGQSSVRVVNRP